jgi:hypothetical protein
VLNEKWAETEKDNESAKKLEGTAQDGDGT